MNSPDVPNCRSSSSEKTPKYLFALLALLNVVLCVGVVRYIVQSDLGSDDVEHAHVTWAMNHGIMPYRDIHQNHTPLLWIISAPLMAVLPRSVGALITLRMLCLLALAGTYAIGLLVLREILGSVNRVSALVLLLLILAVFTDFEFYRYRPDPLMTLCVSCAIWAAIRLKRSPAWYSSLSGIFLGLAASFSPKMAPLCLLIPVLCLLEAWRRHSLRPLLLVIPNALGFIAGILPIVGWLFCHGLFGPFWKWTVVANGHTLNLSLLRTQSIVEHASLTSLLAIVGAWLVLRKRAGAWERAWSPAVAIVVAAALAWLIRILEPHHGSYNLQAFTMPAAVLGTVVLMKRAQWNTWASGWRPVLVGALLVVMMESQAQDSIGLEGPGWTIRMSDMQRLIGAIPAGNATCVGITPWHPIFCRDATDLYIACDISVLWWDCVPLEAKQPFFEMWAKTISVIERGEPSMIVLVDVWPKAYEGNVLSKEQYARFLRALETRYERVDTGGILVAVKRRF